MVKVQAWKKEVVNTYSFQGAGHQSEESLLATTLGNISNSWGLFFTHVKCDEGQATLLHPVNMPSCCWDRSQRSGGGTQAPVPGRDRYPLCSQSFGWNCKEDSETRKCRIFSEHQLFLP